MKVFAPDVVQVPVSVADQRLVHDGTLEELAQRGVTVQVRSIFLQGLLLAPDVPLPARLEPVAGLLRRLPWSGGDVLEAARHCFGYIASLAFVDEIVFGVHSSTQLSTLLSAYENPARAVAWAECARPDAYVDPRTW